MAGFDPYVTTTAAMAMGVGGSVERRSTIMPSRAAEGRPTAAGWRRAVGGFAESSIEGTTSSVFDDEKTKRTRERVGDFDSSRETMRVVGVAHGVSYIHPRVSSAFVSNAARRVRLKRLRSASPRPSVRVVALRMLRSRELWKRDPLRSIRSVSSSSS